MTHSEHLLARRTVLRGLGLGAAAAAAMPAQAATAVPSEGGEIWSSEYWTKKGDIPLWMLRKRSGATKPGEPARAAADRSPGAARLHLQGGVFSAPDQAR